ncbi:hypothetical protein Tco_1202022, partial [Tanacetum coccineum]
TRARNRRLFADDIRARESSHDEIDKVMEGLKASSFFQQIGWFLCGVFGMTLGEGVCAGAKSASTAAPTNGGNDAQTKRVERVNKYTGLIEGQGA